jgi:hypothetical protein
MTMRPGVAGFRRFEKMNCPPEGEPFFWLTKTMLESPAWRALTSPAKRIVERVALEHMNHAGTQNGDLPITYTDFERVGIDRNSIHNAIEVAVALGWIDVVERGQKGFGIARRPSIYSLTWLPRADGSAPTNRWKAIKTDQQAADVVKKILCKPGGCRSPAHVNGVLPGKILKVVGKTVLEKTPQNGGVQSGKRHQTSTVYPTHSSTILPTGEISPASR